LNFQRPAMIDLRSVKVEHFRRIAPLALARRNR
jgi:hypothetical protein